ncbi:MAG: membrane-anchored protein [Spirulina sp. DLM2.Bin59]|nr:MAG: membrane-anchored protein [Spirulina sp. DLM2.Bin59]
MTTTSETTTPPWRFAVTLLAQFALIVGVPAQAMITYFAGEPVILQTAPVDPYDLLRGYSQTLNYEISQVPTLESLPGWAEIQAELDTEGRDPSRPLLIYVVLGSPEAEANPGIPTPWEPVAVALNRPRNLAIDEVALAGQLYYGQVIYGLERYYMPEDQKDGINDHIADINRRFPTNPPMVVEVRVRGNHAVPATLWVGDRAYRF